MSRSTEQLLPGMIPPKEEAKGVEVDFWGILASVKPETLSEEVLSVFARRDLYVTEADREERKKNSSDWRDQAPVRPVEDRLRMAKISRESDERNLQDKEYKYHFGAPNGYKNARTALIKAIGSKVNCYIVQREYDSLSENEREEQRRAFEKWDQEFTARWEQEEQMSRVLYDDEMVPGTRSEKVVRVRKGIQRADGRCFTQREFAKLIEYPINKYTEAEKNDEAVEDVLLEKLIMVCHANPYYLYDDACGVEYGEYEGNAVEWHDQPAIITGYDSILKWILSGKPKAVDWTDEFRETEQQWAHKGAGIVQQKTDCAIDAFCAKEWKLCWEGTTEWKSGRVRTECTAKAEITVRVQDKAFFRERIKTLNSHVSATDRHLYRFDPYGTTVLRKEPGNTAESICSFLEGQMAAELDLDLEDYVTEDDYYPPVMEDYEDNLKAAAESFCELFGLKMLHCVCSGDMSEYL